MTRLGGGAARRPRWRSRGSTRSRRAAARAAARGGAGADPAQVPPHRRSRAVRPARGRRRRQSREPAAPGLRRRLSRRRRPGARVGDGRRDGHRRRPAPGADPGAQVERRSRSTSRPRRLSEVLTGFAADVARMRARRRRSGWSRSRATPIRRTAGRRCCSRCCSTSRTRSDEALAVLSSVPRERSAGRPGRATSRCGSSTTRSNFNEAYADGQARRSVRRRASTDFSRLGDVYEAMKRHDEAADAYGRAIALATAQGLQSELWPLLLLRASALEEANRWPEAKQALQQALAIAPDQPLLLNFLGYAKLERGEDLGCGRSDDPQGERARARRCVDHRFARLGAVQARQGRRGDRDACSARPRRTPTRPRSRSISATLVHVGRRFEARFAWSAALVTAEDDVAGAAQGQARVRPHPGQRRAVTAARARPRRPSSTWRSMFAANCPTDGTRSRRCSPSAPRRPAERRGGGRLRSRSRARSPANAATRKILCFSAARALARARRSRRGRDYARQEPAGRLGHRRRLGRCGRGAAAADGLWKIDPRHARQSRRRSAATSGLPAQHAGARRRGGGRADPSTL